MYMYVQQSHNYMYNVGLIKEGGHSEKHQEFQG